MRYVKFILPLVLLALYAFHPGNPSSKMYRKAYKSFEKSHPDFVYIPGGTWTSERQLSQNEVMVCFGKVDMNTTPSFWMSKYEVSNAKWQSFVKDIRERFGQDSAKKLLPDSNLWSSPISYQEPMRKYYYRHPAYANYPVVCVSIEQCRAYCQWLSEAIQAQGDYMQSVEVRLPTDMEWEYAASSGKEGGAFPWGTDYLRNTKGIFEANFRVLPMQQAKKENGKIKLEVDYEMHSPRMTTAPINMYHQNSFGLYQMGGNVAEFVVASSDSSAAEGQGITCGGSFFDPPYYMQCHARDYYAADSSAHFTRGFRPVLTFKLKEGL